MPGKQKKNPNPLREIKDMIHRLSGKYGTRAEEEQYAREIESDPFYQSLQRIEAGELQAVQRADALDKELKKLKPSQKVDVLEKELKKKKKKDAPKSKTGFFKEMQKEALDEGMEEFSKKKRQRKPSNTPSVREMYEQLGEILLQEYRPDEIIDKFGFDPNDL